MSPSATPRLTWGFGATIEVGRDYHDYVRDRELLALCQPITAHPRERLFIRIHQVCELLFAGVVEALTESIDHLLRDELPRARQSLRRCRVLTEQSVDQVMSMLELVTPGEFAAFRTALGTASGAQSTQFGAIEVLSGSSDPVGPAKCGHTLWQAFLHAARIDPQATEARRIAVLANLLARGEDPLREVALAVRQHDINWRVWRQAHAALVASMIGRARPGTGGTAGYRYLAEKARLRWYHELHAAHALATSGRSA